MSRKNVLVVSHNNNMLTKLKDIIRRLEGDCKILISSKENEAYVYALNYKIDLFLVDIVLNGKVLNDTSGLNLIKNIRSIKHYAFTPIVMISQFEDIALQTYRDMHCYGFIEKPFDVEYVKNLIKDALMFRESMSTNEKIYFRDDGIIFGVEKEKIVYAESINHVIYINTTDRGQFQVRYKTIKRFLDEIDDPNMFQCSRNTVVNRRYIENIDNVNCIIKLERNYGKVEIGVTFREAIKDLFENKINW